MAELGRISGAAQGARFAEQIEATETPGEARATRERCRMHASRKEAD